MSDPVKFGEYIIHSDGQIFSTYFNRFLKQPKKDYKRLVDRTTGKPLLAHRLVATAFIPNPDNLPEVNHINGIRCDNRVENLEWCTRQQNGAHAFRTGLVKNIVRGSNHKDSKFTPVEIGIIREAIIAGFSARGLARYFKVASSTIFRIKSGEHWRVVS